MAIKEYSIEGVYKYRVRDESTGFVVHSMHGRKKIDCAMNINDAKSIVRRACDEMGIKGPHCVHQIGDYIYFDAIVENT